LRRAETIEKAHGRIETRRIAVRTKLPARLDQNWPGVTAICQIERRRESKTYCTRQLVYAITSLPPEKLDPAAFCLMIAAPIQSTRLSHTGRMSLRSEMAGSQLSLAAGTTILGIMTKR
jgi:hypothetical protein